MVFVQRRAAPRGVGDHRVDVGGSANRSYRRQSHPPVARPPIRASSCRCMMSGPSFRRRQTSCPRSISTASEPCRTRGHNKATWRPASERLRADGKKNATPGRKTGAPGNAFWDLRDGTNRLQAAHESFSSRAMLAEVPLAGLSCGEFGFTIDCVAQCETILSVELSRLVLDDGPRGMLDTARLRDVIKSIGQTIVRSMALPQRFSS